MIISDNGIVIRMSASEISVLGRDTQGVRVMRLKGDGNVVCVAVVEGSGEAVEAEATDAAEPTAEQPQE